MSRKLTARELELFDEITGIVKKFKPMTASLQEIAELNVKLDKANKILQEVNKED